MPIWVAAGDDDRLLGVLPMAVQLYERLSAVQRGQTELRIINGELDWSTMRNALPDAIRYVDRKCNSPAQRNAAVRSLKHAIAQADPLEHAPVRR